jgi:hypothetical protein
MNFDVEFQKKLKFLKKTLYFTSLLIKKCSTQRLEEDGLPEVVEVVPVLGHGAVHRVLPHLPCHVVARRKILQI